MNGLRGKNRARGGRGGQGVERIERERGEKNRTHLSQGEEGGGVNTAKVEVNGRRTGVAGKEYRHRVCSRRGSNFYSRRSAGK